MGSIGSDILTIVVPVHRVIGNLEGLRQSMATAHKAEVGVKFILVQDGNDEMTRRELTSLCSSFQAEYLNVNVFSPGLARNAGLDRVTTDWVTFWDSDDYGYAINAVTAIRSAPSNARAIVGGYEVRDCLSGNKIEFNKPEANLTRIMLNPGIWRFIFRTEFIGDVRFNELRMGEDQLFLCKLRLKDEMLHKTDSLLYSYNQQVEGQLTSSDVALNDIVPAILDLSILMEDEKYNAPYIRLIQLKLSLTAIRRRRIGIRGLLKLLVKVSNSPLRTMNHLISICFRFGFLIVLGKLK
jgi:glycosyltransferase involved in cell wall biosynthesis